MPLPADLLYSLENAPGFDRQSFVRVHDDGAQVTSLRLNPMKPVDLSNMPLIASKIPWSTSGYYLSERPQFIFDPLIHAGAYYVQEASSMFLEQAVSQLFDSSTPIKALDLCAAPGGKSTLLHSLLSPDSLLVSNEVIRSRVTVLEENLTKWGAVNVIVTNNDPRDFQKLPGYFDLMIVDAPCSGSGLFRKDPSAVNEWSLQNVALCSQRQQRILADSLPALTEHGVLIYCTCSFSMEEDEAICDWLISEQSMQPLKLQLDPAWNVVESISSRGGYGYRFYPNKLRGEGFYLSCFRNTREHSGSIPKAQKLEKASRGEVSAIGQLVDTNSLFTWKFGERILSFPLQLEKELGVLLPQLYIRKAGLCIGKVAGNGLIPDHEVALSRLLHDDVPSAPLEKDVALQYLRREEFSLPVQPKGWTLATYEGLGLGWMKVLPNRINNYYPKEWRILKSKDN